MMMTIVLVNAAILLGDDAQLCKQLYLLSRIFPSNFHKDWVCISHLGLLHFYR
jgi:hypothetical protein